MTAAMARSGKANTGLMSMAGIARSAEASEITMLRFRKPSWRACAASSRECCCSIRSTTSAASGVDPTASAVFCSSSSVLCTASAVRHRSIWSHLASFGWMVLDALFEPDEVARARSCILSTSLARGRGRGRERRSSRPWSSAYSSLTSPAVSMSTMRWRPPSGRNTAMWRPSSCTISACTPERAAPNAPTSSPMRLSRSSCPTPAITVRRDRCRREGEVSVVPCFDDRNARSRTPSSST